MSGTLIKTLFALCLAAPVLTASAADAANEVTVKLRAHDGKFEPTELLVPAGKKIRIEISNTGKTPIEFESLDLHKEKVLAPGGSSVVVIVAQQPGRYKFFDDFNPKSALGVLVVK